MRLNIKLLDIFRTLKMSTQQNSCSEHLKAIFHKSLEAVETRTLIRRNVQIKNNTIVVCGKEYELKKPCHVVGFGKAVLGMAMEIENILGSNLRSGVVTVPSGIFECFRDKPTLLPSASSRIRYVEGAVDNIPDENALQGALLIKSVVEKLDQEDLLIVLISGGGSALLPAPKHPITLQEKQDLIRGLGSNGADILELNSVRKRLSDLKGGGLATLAYPARTVAMVLSDIVGDPLDFIASGPTTPNTDSPDAAVNIIKKYSLYDKLPESIKTVLKQENQSVTSSSVAVPVVKGSFSHVDNFIVGNNQIAAQAALEQAMSLGYQSAILSTTVNGEVSQISKIYAELAGAVTSRGGDLELFLRSLKSSVDIPDPVINEIINFNFNFGKGICLIAAGEPTVVVKGKGKGGRNQQLALSFSVEVNKFDIKSADISFLSCGTDGIDGPTDAAGAIGSSNLVNNAVEQNIDPTQFLSNNDSYGFYSQFNEGFNLIRTGHTGTNVMDIHILLIIPKQN